MKCPIGKWRYMLFVAFLSIRREKNCSHTYTTRPLKCNQCNYVISQQFGAGVRSGELSPFYVSNTFYKITSQRVLGIMPSLPRSYSERLNTCHAIGNSGLWHCLNFHLFLSGIFWFYKLRNPIDTLCPTTPHKIKMPPCHIL